VVFESRPPARPNFLAAFEMHEPCQPPQCIDLSGEIPAVDGHNPDGVKDIATAADGFLT